MRLVPIALVALAAATAAARPARAQTVRGQLVDAAGRPVEQVLVALVGADGRRAGGALTSGSGEFSIRAPAAGRYSLRAERVGYATVATAPFELKDGETREERVVASGRAVMLQGLVATPRDRRCAVRPGAGLATATLWEEARKALSAAEYASHAGTFWYDVVRWERDLAPGGGAVLRDRRETRGGVSELPFVSISPALLSRYGFIRRMVGDSVVYAAPDAAALLSDEFLDDHCFRVTPGSDPALVGLGFEPVAGRRVPDVRGVIWLDRASAELRRVEYRYVNGPPESRGADIGGSVEFERLRGGPWIVRRWAIRMPVAELVTSGLTIDGSRPVSQTIKVVAVHEAGGEVTSARSLQGGAATRAVSAAAPAVIEGVVWDSVARAPLAGARVILSGTAAEAVTGADGRYRLEAPAAGTYTVTFSEPRLGPISAAVAPRSVAAAAGSTARLDLAVPGPARVSAALCPRVANQAFDGVVTGRVLGVAPDSVAVRATWQRIDLGRVVSGTNAWSETRPDASGFYVLCGVREGEPVEVAVLPARQGRQGAAGRSPQDRRTIRLRLGTELSIAQVTVPRGVPLRLDVGPGAPRR